MRAVRRAWWLRISRPTNLFQPYNDTCENRYPDVFDYLQRGIEDSSDLRLLSFGCSVGDEVFSLRSYFPKATIIGIDISRGNISECRRRWRQRGDERIRFVLAGTLDRQPQGFCDAVLCMAVLRHGDLGYQQCDSCGHRITFQAFNKTVEELARSPKVSGFLVIEHRNFRFRDSSSASHFTPVFSRESLPCPPMPEPPLSSVLTISDWKIGVSRGHLSQGAVTPTEGHVSHVLDQRSPCPPTIRAPGGQPNRLLRLQRRNGSSTAAAHRPVTSAPACRNWSTLRSAAPFFT